MHVLRERVPRLPENGHASQDRASGAVGRGQGAADGRGGQHVHAGTEQGEEQKVQRQGHVRRVRSEAELEGSAQPAHEGEARGGAAGVRAEPGGSGQPGGSAGKETGVVPYRHDLASATPQISQV